MWRWIWPQPGENSTRPQQCSIPIASFTTVFMRQSARFMKKPFTNSGYFLTVFAMAFLLFFVKPWADVKLPAYLLSCDISLWMSGYQFSAHKRVIKNVGGKWPLAMWWAIQDSNSSIFDHQKLLLPLIFREKYLSIWIYWSLPFFRSSLSSSIVGVFFPEIFRHEKN